MSETWEHREARIVDELERRYRDRGYTIEREAKLDGDVCGDIVATRTDETVLIEVRHVGRRSKDEISLELLAEHASRRGWRFTIVLVRDDEIAEEVEVPLREHVLRLVEDASDLDASSWLAPIAATAAFEAAARYVLSRSANAMPRPNALAYVQALASRGLLGPEEERVLRQLIEKHNAAAHGFPARLAPADVVTRGLQIIRELVQPQPAAA